MQILAIILVSAFSAGLTFICAAVSMIYGWGVMPQSWLIIIAMWTMILLISTISQFVIHIIKE